MKGNGVCLFQELLPGRGGALLWTSREKDRNFVGRIVQGVSANAKAGRFGCNNWRGGAASRYSWPNTARGATVAPI